jgi:ubiquinone/menaquinone biosynthesis C-methylase UbiE
MEETNRILERMASMRPGRVLDVGCGCGGFTAQLSPHCGEITAIDTSQALIDRCKEENARANITYVCMDGKEIRYPDNSFDLVAERMVLHHIREWEEALSEMIRVSSKHLLVEEPIDDPRSEEKKNAARARELLLALQNEVGYSHHEYLSADTLIDYFSGRKISIETEIVKSDKLVDFDQFFRSFGDFAEKSSRKEYWFDRLESLKRELDGRKLCEEDIVFIAARKS